MGERKFYLMMVGVVFLLVGCIEGSMKTNSVIQAKLTDRESAILSATSKEHFVYDFNVDDSYKNVTVWVEKYEAGKLVGEVNRISSEIGKDGTIIFTKLITAKHTDPSLFSITIHSNQASASGVVLETINEEELATIWESYPLNGVSVADEMILASIIHSSKETIRTLSEEFYKDGKIDELANYDVVYVLRGQFQ